MTKNLLGNSRTDEDLIIFLESQGFTHLKQLEGGDWVGILPLAFSTSVCSGIDWMTPFKYRWCFKHPKDAIEFLKNMQDFDDIPCDMSKIVGHRYIDKPLIRVKDERGFDKW